MTNTKPLHLRSDEFNDYIEDCKQKYSVLEGDITHEEKNIIHRCGIDYGLSIKKELGTQNIEQGMTQHDYNLILRIKGPYTLPESANWSGDRGSVNIRPYIIHEFGAAQRLKSLAQKLITEKLVESVVPIDSEYLYEALRDTAFTIAMKDVIGFGEGFQIIQVEFDENGHFKAIELDETH